MHNSNPHIVHDIPVALAQIKHKISAAEQRFARPPGSVRLLAVSKTRSVDAIRSAVDVGQIYLAENYLQEATAKIIQLSNSQIEWHFIGSIQSNKVPAITEHFQWIHSVDRLKVLYRINECAHRQPIHICLQVNISAESSKGGIAIDNVLQMAAQCASLPNIRLRGLMAMPAPTTDFASQRHAFAALRGLFTELQKQYADLDTLSMGTSNDFIAAIAEGSTMVRIGTAIFGAPDTQ